MLLCVQTGKTMADPNRFKFDADDYYLKSAEEMRAASGATCPRRATTRCSIAERCEVGVHRGRQPDAAVPGARRARPRSPGWSQEVERGLRAALPGRRARRRTASRPSTSSASSARWASRATSWSSPTSCATPRTTASGSVPGAGRPPARWSRTRWASPSSTRSQHGLLFERFLNPERVSMPDIDMDFDERRRGDMIRYATEKYGEERVAQIITYGTIKAKPAIKDSARVLGYPFAVGDRITKAMPPPVMGKDIPLVGHLRPRTTRATSEAGEFRALYESDADVQRVVDTARGLEGLKRQWGVHAAGVILSARAAARRASRSMRREQDGAIITQFDMGACESLGLLKMDFLGLRNLTVLDDCLRNIEANRGDDRRARGRSPLDDTHDLRAAGPRRHARRLPARRRADAGAAALDASRQLRGHLRRARALPARARWAPTRTTTTPTARTAASRSCRSTRSWPSRCAEILGDTYGLIVYQEQVMAIAQKVAGYSLGKADLLRRAMGKKKKEILDKEYVPFSDGHARRTATPTARSRRCGTSWSRSPTTRSTRRTPPGYGLVSYWTAYLKANYPAEYMAALLTSASATTRTSRRSTSTSAGAWASRCCRRTSTSPTPTSPRSAPTSASAWPRSATSATTSSRRSCEARTRRRALRRLLRLPRARSTPVVCNKKTRRVADQGRRVRLARATPGAGCSRCTPRRSTRSSTSSATRRIGQFDLFGGERRRRRRARLRRLAAAIPVGEWDKTALLAFEREMLGLYVSDHPLLGVEHVLAPSADCRSPR